MYIIKQCKTISPRALYLMHVLIKSQAKEIKRLGFQEKYKQWPSIGKSKKQIQNNLKKLPVFCQNGWDQEV